MGNLSGESSLSGALSIPTQMMPGTNNYNDLSNKPKINGHTLTGNLGLSDVGIPTSYDDLSDRPVLNGHTLTGNLSLGDVGIPTSYDDLGDKPTLNGHTVVGDMTSDDLGIKSGYDAQLDPLDPEHLILSN